MKRIVSFWNWVLGISVVLKFSESGVPGIKLRTPNVPSDVIEYPEVNAVIGSRVLLPCNLTPPSPDDSILLVLWYRLDLSNPVYTLDARASSSADKAKHFSGKVLGTRSYFNVSGQRPSQASLRIDPVEEGDAGEYRCRIDFKRGRTLSRNVKLNVIVPTSSLVIKDKDNRSLSGVIGPYTEGAAISLTCQAYGGRPQPAVTWWKKDVGLIDDSFDTDEDKSIVTNELNIENVRREELMSVLTCQASNTNLTAPMAASVTIDLNLNPTSVQITTVERPVSVGETIEITCKAQGSRPPARISWWKGKNNLDHLAVESLYNDVSSSRLIFEPLYEDDGKTLICKAENPEVPNSALEEKWTLNVYYPPIVNLLVASKNHKEYVREGNDIFLECRIQANPPVTDVQWRFRSRPLIHEPAKGVLHLRNHTLLLQNVKRSNRGGYRCTATNLEGEGVSEEVELRVQYAPVCSSRQRNIYGVARHEEANISCQVEADPQEVSFRWSFNNSLGESIDVLSYSSDGGTHSIARYIPRTKLDYGVLFCFARNSVGAMKDPCAFAIVPTGPPEAVQNCTVTNRTSSSLMVVCEAGDDGGLSQVFQLEIYSMKTEQPIANITSAESPSFIAEGLPASTSFFLVIFAWNLKGRSTSVALTASTLLSAELRADGNNHVAISAVLVVLMGVIGALVLFAIIIILIMKSRSEKRATRGKNSQDEKVPSPVENSFEDKQPDIFNSKNFQTEYVDLTPNARTERIYENLGDSKEYTYENIVQKTGFPPAQNTHPHHMPAIVAR